METLRFVPRKLKQKPKTDGTNEGKETAGDRLDGNGQLLTKEPGPSFMSRNERAAIPEGMTAAYSGRSEKGKQKEEFNDQSYLNLMSLALSDYSIWSTDSIRELLDKSEDGFLPISFLLDTSPIFGGETSHPPESSIIRSIKESTAFDVRIALVEPDASTWRSGAGRFNDGNVGGYEIRRRDWGTLKERIRKYTAYQWEERTVHIENIPVNARTMSGIYDFVQNVAKSTTDTERQLLQYISFPRHHNDPNDFHPIKCKGFAFLIFTQASDARAFTERWPWDVRIPVKAEEGGTDEPFVVSSPPNRAIIEARSSGLRSLSKKRWDTLKREYLDVQAQLLAKVAKSSSSIANGGYHKTHADAPVEESHTCVDRTTNGDGVRSTPIPAGITPITYNSYPPNCLVFVKNVHPETNKTTLRTLFSKPFNGSTEEIDYVDYNKGLDSCYLRLNSARSAQLLVQYFTSNMIGQADGLDNAGVPLKSRTFNTVEVELIQGMKEEVYWNKVPEKVRKQALAKAYPEVSNGVGQQEDTEGRRKVKRRKMG